jgi:hypothetical protein
MKTIVATAALALLLAAAGPCRAGDTVTGSVTVKGKKVSLTQAFAHAEEGGMVRVLLSDVPLPAGAQKDMTQRMSFAAEKKITLLDFVAWPTGPTKIMNVTLFHPSLPSLDQVPAHEAGHVFTIKSADPKHLAASFKSEGEKKTMSAGAPLSYDVTFDVAVR